jgi:hypothetical protein
MSRLAVPLLFASVLAACGGGGGDAPTAPAAAPATSAVGVGGGGTGAPLAAAAANAPASPAPAPAARAPAPAAPSPAPMPAAAPAASGTVEPAASQVATAGCTYPDMVGKPKPCDPRWPHPGVIPPTGSTQDQVDGYNSMCLTMICTQALCPDGRVLPFYVANHECPAAPAPLAPPVNEQRPATP